MKEFHPENLLSGDVQFEGNRELRLEEIRDNTTSCFRDGLT